VQQPYGAIIAVGVHPTTPQGAISRSVPCYRISSSLTVSIPHHLEYFISTSTLYPFLVPEKGNLTRRPALALEDGLFATPVWHGTIQPMPLRFLEVL